MSRGTFGAFSRPPAAHERQVAPHDCVAVTRIDLQAQAASLQALGGYKRAARTQEQVQHALAAPTAVAQGSLCKGQRFLGGVAVIAGAITMDLPQRGFVGGTVPAVRCICARGLAVRPPAVQAELDLLIVVSVPDSEALLRPYDHARNVRTRRSWLRPAGLLDRPACYLPRFKFEARRRGRMLVVVFDSFGLDMGKRLPFDQPTELRVQ